MWFNTHTHTKQKTGLQASVSMSNLKVHDSATEKRLKMPLLFVRVARRKTLLYKKNIEENFRVEECQS